MLTILSNSFNLTISLLVCFSIKFSYSQEKETPYYKDQYYKNLTAENQLKHTDSLYKVSILTNKVNLQRQALKQLVNLNYNLKNWKEFEDWKDKYLDISFKRNDTLAIARTYEYVAAYKSNISQMDSSYYYYSKSYHLYEKLKDSVDAGLMLLNLAIIQKNMRDYSGSEVKSLKALYYLKGYKNKRRLSSIYNNLGIVNNNLKNYESALSYHSIAYDMRRELDSNSIFIIHSLNNIGKIYKDQEEYEIAINYFKKALENNILLDKYPKVKATLIDNYAHSKFKQGDSTHSIEQLLEALYLRENENDKYGIIKSSIHLAEYHNQKNEKEKALEYLTRAESLSKELNEYKDYLESLEFIIPLYDSKESERKFKQYVNIRDSLELDQKSRRESFAKIDLQVQEKNELIEIKNTELQSKSKKATYLLLLVLLLLISIMILIYFKKHQKLKLEESFDELEKTKNHLTQAVLDNHYSTDEKFESFHIYLKGKFNLTDVLLEYWILRANRKTKKEISTKLFVSENSIADRRKRLIKKLKEFHGESEVSRSFLVDLYSEELSIFLKKNSESTGIIF